MSTDAKQELPGHEYYLTAAEILQNADDGRL